ncbi:hypothetical protein CEDDRAFT_00112 [Frankia sp. CeD]|nr:hypothetical protein CEDDRAFT_00112 [Frankia sp. CeD]
MVGGFAAMRGGEDLAEDQGQFAEGSAAVADRILLRRGQFGVRPGLTVGQEQWVVAEAAHAARFGQQGAT